MDLSRVCCPTCEGDLRDLDSSNIRCFGCGRHYPILDGIPSLRTDQYKDTALDVAEYNDEAPFSPKGSESIFRYYETALEKEGVSYGACLELGSGSGNLTYGLVHCGKFSEINCSDISPRFLARLKRNVGNSDRLRYWLLDADHIPFRAASLDAIVAHSVLHHLLEYEAVLRRVAEVLKPRGLAMFGEPIMDFFATTSFLAGVILEVESRLHLAKFGEKEKNLLGAIEKYYSSVGRLMRESRADLAEREDKHIFTIRHMERVGRDAWFSAVRYLCPPAIPSQIGALHKSQILETFERSGLNSAGFEKYDFVFERLADNYSAGLGEYVPRGFGFFIFVK